MRNAVVKNEGVADSPHNFMELLKARARFFREILGENEYELILKGALDDENSFDICPEFISPKELDTYWDKLLAKFSNIDPNLTYKLESIEGAVKYLKEIFFDPSDTTGLAILMTGNYNTMVFNRDDVVDAARLFLDATNADDYMLITACGKEVMIQPIDGKHKRWENKFLGLVTDMKYSDRVFPIMLPERPEFRFFGRLYGKKPDNPTQKCQMAFYTHGVAGDDII